MPPQVGVGGCTPRPRNDRADSITITRAMSSVATTSHGVKVLGSTWLHNTRPFRLPSAIAACTYSRSRIESTSPRTTRAYTTHDDTPMTMMMLRRLGPRTPITAIASRLKGEREVEAAQPHQEVVPPPAEVPGHQPGDHTEHARDQHRREAHHQRDPRAVYDAGQDVAPQMIGAERVHAPLRVLPPRRPQPLPNVLLERIEGRYQRRQQRGQQHAEEHQHPEERGASPHQAPQQRDPLALRPRARGRQGGGLGGGGGGRR